MPILEKSITLKFAHRIIFTRNVFARSNDALANVLAPIADDPPSRVLALINGGVAAENPGLAAGIGGYFSVHASIARLTGPAVVLPGGEACKNDWSLVERVWGLINDAGLDRHSHVVAVGGGAFLDLAGFAAATAHRGIRHVRVPTTSLSQGDGAVGVKNGVNYFGKKNWIGAFAVPHAVVADFEFLRTLPADARRAGLIEAIKVSLLRDGAFFSELERRVDALAALDQDALEFAIQRSAELHVDHIASGGDPFEFGSARPLDFGHWVAHKLEPASGYRLGHGEAVAIGMAVDLVYAKRCGFLAAADCERILCLMERIGFRLYDSALEHPAVDDRPLVLAGLEEFREHLGGRLTITLVTGPGAHVEVHEMSEPDVLATIAELRERQATH